MYDFYDDILRVYQDHIREEQENFREQVRNNLTTARWEQKLKDSEDQMKRALKQLEDAEKSNFGIDPDEYPMLIKDNRVVRNRLANQILEREKRKAQEAKVREQKRMESIRTRRQTLPKRVTFHTALCILSLITITMISSFSMAATITANYIMVLVLIWMYNLVKDGQI